MTTTRLLPLVRSLSGCGPATRQAADALALCWSEVTSGAQPSVPDGIVASLLEALGMADARDSRAALASRALLGLPGGGGPPTALGELATAFAWDESGRLDGEAAAPAKALADKRAELEARADTWIPLLSGADPELATRLRARCYAAGEMLDRGLLRLRLLSAGPAGMAEVGARALRRSLALVTQAEPLASRNAALLEGAIASARGWASLPAQDRPSREVARLSSRLQRTLPRDESQWGAYSLVEGGVTGLLEALISGDVDADPVGSARAVAYYRAVRRPGRERSFQIDAETVLDADVVAEALAQESDLREQLAALAVE